MSRTIIILGTSLAEPDPPYGEVWLRETNLILVGLHVAAGFFSKFRSSSP